MRKSLFTVVMVLTATMMCAQEKTIILDLSKSTTELTFNTENGSWNGTYDDDETSIESQVFDFVHSSMSDWQTWWGFTASNSVDNKQPQNVITHQWSNMALGGIALNEDGTVKLDEFGAPVSSAEMPYLVAFYSPYMSRRPVTMTFTDGKSYTPVGAYVNLNSYSYYSIQDGDGYARAFTNGDKFELEIHGVAADESEKSVKVSMASYSNGCLTTSRGWQYVDLSDLGAVNEIYFTMTSTDSGAYGANTPLYFCLDKLSVKTDNSGVQSVRADMTEIRYDRTTATVTAVGGQFVAVYDVTGAMLASSEEGRVDISGLAAGVYIAKCGNNAVKIAR